MSGILNSVDQRTNLVGENRLELLMFRLNSRQLFAINVFKVKEILKLPALTQLPQSHPHVRGIASLREQLVPVIDLRAAIGFPARKSGVDIEESLIITEYNRTVQGFLVDSVENIINTSWTDITPPPKTTGKSHYLTAITKIEVDGISQIVEIIDVEKILAQIIKYDVSISEDILNNDLLPYMRGKKILVVDDSKTARNQLISTLDQFDIEVIECIDGLEAFNLLKKWKTEGYDFLNELLMVITDAEMPEMDGYSLTREIRADESLKDLFVVLNTSLSGSFNNSMSEKVGCDKFISKFQPDVIMSIVQDRLIELMK